MAAPTIESFASSLDTSNGAVPVVDYPATVTSGNTILSCLSVDGGSTIVWPAGFTDLGTVTHDGANHSIAAAWRKADGTEGGGTFTYTGATSQKAAHYVVSIAGAIDPTVTAPSIASSTGTSATPDPANISSLASNDYLVFAFASTPNDNQATVFPSGYGDTGTTGVGSGGASLGWAALGLTSITSENPGTFTVPSSDGWGCYTVAVPSSSGGGGASPTELTLLGVGA